MPANSIPGPPPLWLLRNANLLRKRPVAFFDSLAAEYGDLVRFPMGKREFFLVNRPDLIQQILVTQGNRFEKFPKVPRNQGLFGEGLLTSEEPLHMRQRRLLQPAFHRDRIAGYAQIMTEASTQECGAWKDGMAFDAAASMNRLALRIVSRALFSADTEKHAAEIGHSLDIVLRMLNKLVLPPGPLLLRIPIKLTRDYHAALGRMDDLIHGLISQRRREATAYPDLLGMLLDARDPETGKAMTDVQLRDEVMTLFVAGHDTTANALTWTWYVLSQHPEAEARLHDELDSVLDRRAPTADDYPRLEYTERVLSESMRLYPPVWIMGRRPLESFSLDGIPVTPNSVFLICMRVLHRREELYQDAAKFNPDRWLPQIRSDRHRYAFLPFGAGSRLCIGERFAWMEGVLAIASIAQRWRLRLKADAVVNPLALITLRPENGLPMTAHLRR